MKMKDFGKLCSLHTHFGFSYSFQFPHIHLPDEKCLVKIYDDFNSLKNKTSCFLVVMQNFIIYHVHLNTYM